MANPLCPRAQSALILKFVLVEQQSLTDAISELKIGLSDQDASLCQALAYGVTRHYFSLYETVSAYIDKPLRNKDYDVLALLLIGSYQLTAMRLPDYAAINSCVEASKKLNKPWAKGLINAVLRKVQKNGIINASASSQYEHPDWLIGKIKKAWPDQFEQVLQQNNQQAPFCLRINQQKTSLDKFSQQLDQQDLNNHPSLLSPVAIYLDSKPQDIAAVDGFDGGAFSVQDEAAQMCGELLAIEAGQHILDACAAPGGKTCHILEKCPDNTVIALDIDDYRLERVEENLARLELNAEVLAADASEPEHWFDGKAFDRILCDAPCSATGVIRRHPDIKLLRRPDDIKTLILRQAEILDKLWPLLKPGGILLYATCSILPEENTRQIGSFLHKHNDATEIKITLPSGLATEHGWQLLPDEKSHDGFFYAKLQKHAV